MSKSRITTDEYLSNKELDQRQITTDEIKKLFSESEDLVYQNIIINKKVCVSLLFVSGLVNQFDIGDLVIKPLVNSEMIKMVNNHKELIECIENGYLYFPSIKKTSKLSDVVNDILMGSCAIVIDSMNIAFLLETKGFDKRAVDTPSEQKSLKGGKDCFVETLNSNTAILRRKIRNPALTIKNFIIGRISNTTVSLIYLDGICDESLIKQMEDKINSIDVDHVLYTSVIEENIVDNKDTTFPLVHYTEQPDFLCQSLFEGRFGILIDGIPFALIYPTTITNIFQTVDDYSSNFISSSIIRCLRYIFATLSIILPGFYVAVTCVHFEMIPDALAMEILLTEQGIPFPIYIETIVLMIAFQALVEAGIRIWNSVGGMIAIVGALIVGEAAISAHYVSPGVVVIVAMSMISLFTVPNPDMKNSLWIWSLIIIMLSSILGLFSLSIGIIVLIYHLAKMEECDIPYLSPFVAHDNQYFQDTFYRSFNVFKKQKKQISDVTKK